MHGTLRRHCGATTDLPLRLMAGVVLSSIVLGVSFGAAESLRAQRSSDWAGSTLDELRASVGAALSRPGSITYFAIDPPDDGVSLRLSLPDGRAGPARASIARGAAVLASGLVCADCAVNLTGSSGGLLLVQAASVVSIEGDSGRHVTIEVVSG